MYSLCFRVAYDHDVVHVVYRWRCAGRLTLLPPPTAEKKLVDAGNVTSNLRSSAASQPDAAKQQIPLAAKSTQPRTKQRIQAAAAVM